MAGGILEPGAHRAAGIVDDGAVIAAMLRVESEWARILQEGGAASAEQADAITGACERLAGGASGGVDAAVLAESAESAGNPVVPLVSTLRAAVAEQDPAAADRVHRGLTSQDVLDTALMLVARDAAARIAAELRSIAESLAGHARAHETTVMTGRTLTQPAVPITFGLKAARWLSGVLDGLDAVTAARDGLPVQCGGAAGTLSLAGILVADPLDAESELARRLRLADPGVPWHTVRTPITRLGDALATACQGLGVVAADVATLSRPEIGELHEGGGGGRGGSSTMPHKRNPVLSVLIRSAALRAPHQAATLHSAAGQAVDERPDGAWHAEWPALQDLLTTTMTASAQAAVLAAELAVDTAAMERNVRTFADGLLAEPRGIPAGLPSGPPPASPGEYLGAARSITQRVLDRFAHTIEGGN
ncbi:lyase family protein [Tomitella gaofuii]|uniref:lyase family protein n=1 Tax=Tomitella gaofuii TaxID=2760083 RepID=UPI0015FA379B|nr:lyase family protein [Tomitella gaofuii]